MENTPAFPSHNDVAPRMEKWLANADQQQDTGLSAWMRAAPQSYELGPLFGTIWGHSPYLSHLLQEDPALLRLIASDGLERTYLQLMDFVRAQGRECAGTKALMRHLRLSKAKLALLTAIADISGQWGLEPVTQALSDFAQMSLSLAVDHLLQEAQARGEIGRLSPEQPSLGSGIIVLAMGKLGGRELNYSSDIDLIIFFESGRLDYKGRHNEQHFMNKLAQELMHIMQVRTPEGYVFRTDLRLRPDPASTPPAINTEAATYYYEGVGQNWERAAMIKARPVAGDIAAGELFMKNLRPFMWRKSLDFASINDIHSIKRQMDTRQSKDIKLAGHNIKLGLGGIREIEFFVQIHQLIWGGRQPQLRLRPTCEALQQLALLGLITRETQQIMEAGYRYLRKLEHRLQMVADEQTHELPEQPEELEHIRAFMGYDTMEAFERELMTHLNAVHGIFASSFRSAEKLGDEGNLVFTGVTHDPETLETIRTLGYQNPETVSEIIMGWHHGSRRCTRTKRARELLTELMPLILKRLAETANPDEAFLKFNDFLADLPAGVQLFSLFSANPDLLGLIADIMGSAPLLAELLSKSPSLMDAVLYADFYDELPTPSQLSMQLADMTGEESDFEETMNKLRQFKNEKHFQAGVQLLRGMIDARQAGVFLSNLADLLIGRALEAVTAEFVRSYGTIDGSGLAVIALGKLGSREMTFISDIDLVFVYDAPDPEKLSSGEKSFSASVYYNRLGQRLLTAITGLGEGGRLYEVDTRLRPSGSQGLLASGLQALRQYLDESAWTFEIMAFTKARVIAGAAALEQQIEACVAQQITKPRDPEKLRADVTDMRERIEKEFGTVNPWDVKYVRGGIIDVDFIAQYLLLKQARLPEGNRPRSANEIFSWLETPSLLPECDRFLVQTLGMLRLCSMKALDAKNLPRGLKKILCESLGAADFDALQDKLIAVESEVTAQYDALLA